MKLDIREIKTYYINLDRDVDRKNSMELMLKKNGFKNYERVEGILGENRTGCSLSHVKALKTAIKNDQYPYLILEDDASIFIKNFLIEVPDDADAMYLGLSVVGSNLSEPGMAQTMLKIKELDENKHVVVNMLARHAILHINKDYDLKAIEYNEKFIYDPKSFFAGDVAISQLNKDKRVYALNTPIFYQSDIKTRSLTELNIHKTNFEIVWWVNKE